MAGTEISVGLHIAFINAPMVGEIFPTLAVVEELIRRGHRITYATAPERAELLAGLGAEVITYTSTMPPDGDRSVLRPDRLDFLPMVRAGFLAEAEATLHELREAHARDVPDVIVYRAQLLVPRMLAAGFQVPCVEFWPFLGTCATWSIGRHLKVADPNDEQSVAFRATVDEFIASRLPGGVESYRAAAPRRQLMFYPRSFQYHGDEFGEPYAFVGPCIGRRPFQPPWQPPEPPRPVVLVSLGTVYNRDLDFYRTAMDAFAGTRWHVELAIGRRTDPAELGPAPSNVRVSAAVPQLAVLRSARAFVTHAGMGGIMEALRYGVPMVTLPQTPEQEVNADRVVELGLGTRLPAEGLAPGELLGQVELAAADAATARRLAAARREIESCGGAALAADLVEAAAR